MAIRDRFDKVFSYFDMDDVNELDDVDVPPTDKDTQENKKKVKTEEVQVSKPKPIGQRPASPQEPTRATYAINAKEQAPARPKPVAPMTQPSASRPTPVGNPQVKKGDNPSRHLQAHAQAGQQQVQVESSPKQTTKIALKYPRRYEDAPSIVDLLINNECVLIDFEYMLEAQARRCLDYLDGASKVLYGSLKKVGASMWLLTPANVVVDIEEIMMPNAGPDLSYDYDMKRR